MGSLLFLFLPHLASLFLALFRYSHDSSKRIAHDPLIIVEQAVSEEDFRLIHGPAV